jgi:hypothetical protein
METVSYEMRKLIKVDVAFVNVAVTNNPALLLMDAWMKATNTIQITRITIIDRVTQPVWSQKKSIHPLNCIYTGVEWWGLIEAFFEVNTSTFVKQSIFGWYEFERLPPWRSMTTFKSIVEGDNVGRIWICLLVKLYAVGVD